MKTRALLMTGVNQLAVEQVEIAEPGPGELLLEAELTAISPGTELRCLAGQQNGATFPFIPGYSFLGRVIGRGEGATLPDGTRIFCGGARNVNRTCCWGGHIAHAVTSEKGAKVVPESLDARAAALTKLACISYNGWRLGRAKPGENVVVFGLGPIGIFSALVHKAKGCNVLALDPVESRRKFAESLGLKTGDPTSPDARNLMPEGAPTVVDSTGVPAVLETAMTWVQALPWGLPENAARTLIMQGSYPEGGNISIGYNDAFTKELRIVVPRDHCSDDALGVIKLMAEGRMDPSTMVSRIADPKDALEVYSALRNRDPKMITAAFAWK